MQEKIGLSAWKSKYKFDWHSSERNLKKEKRITIPKGDFKLFFGDIFNESAKISQQQLANESLKHCFHSFLFLTP